MESSVVTVARAITTPSNLRRRELCPGSARMEAGLPDDDSLDARSGRLFHSYWANPNFVREFLKQDEQDLLELTDRLMSDVLNKLAFETDHEFFVEQNLWTKMGFNKLSGTPDRVYIWPQRKSALVGDLKSGFAQVERAELNLQLRGYAVIAKDNFDVEHVYVSLLQPRLFYPSERITMAHYEKADIDRSRKQITAIIDATVRENAPLVAGEEQCRYCRAKLTCPAFRAAVTLPVGAYKSELELSKAARDAWIAKRVAGCNDEQLEQVIEACKLADLVAYPARDEARRRIRAGGFGKFILGKDWSVRTITNVRRAIAMLALANVASREDVLDSCTISLEKIEGRYRDRRKLTWKAARTKIDKVLASVIQREDREPKILRK
jgi:hypothetical protein